MTTRPSLYHTPKQYIINDNSKLDKPERVPFVITYNPALRSISSIIRKHFHILILSLRYYNVFKAAPIVAYRRSSNLSDSS